VVKRYKAALKGFWFRAGFSRLVLKPNAKRVIGPDPVFGPVAFVVDLGPEPSLDSGADAARVWVRVQVWGLIRFLSSPRRRHLRRSWMLLWL
jgi:hypothetical protein